MPVGKNHIVNLKELSKVFGDEFFFTPMFGGHSIVSSELLEDHYEDVIFNAFFAFKHDNNIIEFDDLIVEIIEKSGNTGKVKISNHHEDLYELTIPDVNLLFITKNKLDNGDVEC